MTIVYDAVNDLVGQLQAQYQDLDLMYEDDAQVELSEKNQGLYEKLTQALHAWNRSIEDQILEETRGPNKYLDEEAWLIEDEEFLEDSDGWIDGDLDEYIGRSL